MNVLGLLGALGVGVAFGYGAQRGSFCMNSGLQGPIAGEWTKLKALGLAIAIQLVALPVVFSTGLARAAEPPLLPLAAVVGGVVFGVSMRWAGGCAAGVWYKLGAGDGGALPSVVGMALGAIAFESGPLLSVRAALQHAVPGAPSWRPPAAVSAGAGLLLLALLARLGNGRAGAWSWRTTGTWIGAVGLFAWPASAAAGRDFGLAVVPGTTGLLSAVAGSPFLVWDSVLVLGMLLGGGLAARQAGSIARSASGSSGFLKRFAGGLGLGIGASVAGGCTVGHGLTGLALLAPSSLVVMAAIFGGSTAAALVARRHGERCRLAAVEA
jgi:hypothetical protein